LNSKEYPADGTILVYKNLAEIIDIFQTCPAVSLRDRNKSTNFINCLERMPLMKSSEEFTRVDLLLQHISYRILEKFKGFRQGFRRFDKNFDGGLNFQEFVSGLIEMGIHVSMADYRLIFEKIDFDKGGEVDYFKFCLLDYDKEAMRE
jgi:Ca2+-binding EF-hand superfamily protein